MVDAEIAAGLRAYHEWDSRVEEPEGLVISVLEAAAQARTPQRGRPTMDEKRVADVIDGMLEIAELAMPETFYAVDRRVRAAIELLREIDPGRVTARDDGR